MKKMLFIGAFCGALLVTGFSHGADYASTQPVPRTQQFEWMSLSGWYQKHTDDVRAAEAGQAQVVLLGDSITDGWDNNIWKQQLAPLGAVNFGIGGDLTQNLLWRLDNGAIEQLDPKVVVILIGVNNFLHQDASAAEAFAGVKAVVERALAGYSNAYILLQGIFPYEASANHPNRQRVIETNALIAKLAEHPRVHFHDFGPLLLEDNGAINPAIMGDYLHPTASGYQRWADALLPVIQSLLKL
ncbi:MAG TPA: GDSL-type esterase/lipase family protein [Cellvibrionaceae bacterium]